MPPAPDEALRPSPAQDEVLRSPLARGFFLLAARAELPVGQLCRPAVAAALAAEAAIQLNPWTGYAAEARTEVLGRAGALRGLAREVLADPRAAWWWEPVGRRQVFVGSADGPADVLPVADESGWSAYAQRPERGLVTSNAYDGGSAMHTALAARVGDLDPQYPLRQVELTVSVDARVYEVRTAHDWRALTLRHPIHRDHTASDPAGLTSDVAPDWTSVAGEWDGVHLTFGGLLVASLVPLGGAGDRTVLWTWECEQTVWLRDVFPARVELSPLAGPAPLALDVGPFELAAARPRPPESAWLRPVTARPPGVLGRLRRRRPGSGP